MSSPEADFNVTKVQDERDGVLAKAPFPQKLLVLITLIATFTHRNSIFPLPPEVDFNVTKHQSDGSVILSSPLLSTKIGLLQAVGIVERYQRGVNRIIGEAIGSIQNEVPLKAIHPDEETVGTSVEKFSVADYFRTFGERISVKDSLDTFVDYFRTSSEVIGVKDTFHFLYSNVIVEVLSGIETVQDVRVIKNLQKNFGTSIFQQFSFTRDYEVVIGTIEKYEQIKELVQKFSITIGISDSVTPFTSKLLNLVIGVRKVFPITIFLSFSERIGIQSIFGKIITILSVEKFGIIDRISFIYSLRAIKIVAVENILDNNIFFQMEEVVGVVDERVVGVSLPKEEVISQQVTKFNIIFKNLGEAISLLDVRDTLRTAYIRVSETLRATADRRMYVVKTFRQNFSTSYIFAKNIRIAFSERLEIFDSLSSDFLAAIRRISAVGANTISFVSRIFINNQATLFERARHTETENIENSVVTFDPRNDVDTYDEFNKS